MGECHGPSGPKVTVRMESAINPYTLTLHRVLTLQHACRQQRSVPAIGKARYRNKNHTKVFEVNSETIG